MDLDGWYCTCRTIIFMLGPFVLRALLLCNWNERKSDTDGAVNQGDDKILKWLWFAHGIQNYVQDLQPKPK
jgi:hypothetical protein